MSNLTSDPSVIATPVFASSTTALHHLGTRAVDRAGRVFRYVKAGAAALVAGNVIQSAAQVANHQNLAPTADVAVGATTLTVTLGATAATANQYAGGLMIVSTTPGLGVSYVIKSHPAANASATLALTLADDTPIQVALTAAASKVDLVANLYSAVIQSPVTTLTGAIVGGAVHPIGIGEFGWIQTGGEGAALIVGTPTVGHCLSAQTTAAGALAINSTTLPIVAIAMVTGVDGRVQAVKWVID